MVNELIKNTIDMLATAEGMMRAASGMLSAMIGTEVLAIRSFGVHVNDYEWVMKHPYEIKAFDKSVYTHEVSCEIDGVTYFALMTESQYNKAFDTEEDDEAV